MKCNFFGADRKLPVVRSVRLGAVEPPTACRTFERRRVTQAGENSQNAVEFSAESALALLERAQTRKTG